MRIFMKREKILKVFVLLELMLLAGFSSVYFYGKEEGFLPAASLQDEGEEDFIKWVDFRSYS